MRCSTLVLVMIALVGCPVTSSAQDSPTAIDLEGLPIWTTAATPTLSIGEGDEPSHSLFRVWHVDVTAGGRLVATNAGSNEVRVFDADGGLVTTLGGPGRGPGEFQQLSAAWSLSEDTVVAWDDYLRRASLFSIEDGFLTTIRLTPELRGARMRAVSGPHRLVVVDSRYGGVGDGEVGQLDEHRFVYDTAGEQLDSLGLAGGATGAMRTMGEGMSMRPSLFDLSTHYAAAGPWLWVQTARHAGVTLQHLGTGELRAVRWRPGGRPVTDAARDAEIERALAGAAPEDRARGRRDLAGRPVPDVLPETAGVVADPSGQAWIHDLAPGADGQGSRWVVVDTTGAPIRRVHLPPRMTPMAVRDDTVFVVERDDYDVEYVRVYGIRQAGR